MEGARDKSHDILFNPVTKIFELVCRSKIPYKIEKLEQKHHFIHHNFDNVTITLLFFEIGQSSELA